MKALTLFLVAALTAVGTDYVHQEGDASLTGPTLPKDKSEVEKPAIQREEDREAAMPDAPTPQETEQQENLEDEERP